MAPHILNLTAICSSVAGVTHRPIYCRKAVRDPTGFIQMRRRDIFCYRREYLNNESLMFRKVMCEKWRCIANYSKAPHPHTHVQFYLQF